MCGKGVPFTNTRGSGGCYIDDVLGVASIRRLQAILTTWVPRHDLREDCANMRHYIDMDLTRLYNLDPSTKEKPVMKVDDGLSVIPP